MKLEKTVFEGGIVLPKKIARALMRVMFWQRIFGKLGLSRLYWWLHVKLSRGIKVYWKDDKE